MNVLYNLLIDLLDAAVAVLVRLGLVVADETCGYDFPQE